jgi:hypothetical protein
MTNFLKKNWLILVLATFFVLAVGIIGYLLGGQTPSKPTSTFWGNVGSYLRAFAEGFGALFLFLL